MSKNIVLLSGSPRAGGNTDMLAAAFIEGAVSAGKSVKLFRVAELKIGGCVGCGHCFLEKGVCVQKDDIPQVLTAIRQADALVLASPIYYWSVTAQLKLAIDRLYPLISVKAPVQRAAMLLTCGNKSESVNEGALFMLKRLCDAYGWDNAGAVTAAGLHEKGEIAGRSELDDARKLGGEI
ncbi:MAG: flavodoxin family protein [Oscillospiraceae bacterium]|jgi:multimeric flavodoxin WrbA|nr:flavodoxin family protein [Oscillospiraceae bacterium]